MPANEKVSQSRREPDKAAALAKQGNTQNAKHEAALNKALDEALQQTFPASDPVNLAPDTPRSPR